MDSQRSIDTHGMPSRAAGMCGYQSHAAYGKYLVGFYPWYITWEQIVGADQLGLIQRVILCSVILLHHLKSEEEGIHGFRAARHSNSCRVPGKVRDLEDVCA